MNLMQRRATGTDERELKVLEARNVVAKEFIERRRRRLRYEPESKGDGPDPTDEDADYKPSPGGFKALDPGLGKPRWSQDSRHVWLERKETKDELQRKEAVDVGRQRDHGEHDVPRDSKAALGAADSLQYRRRVEGRKRPSSPDLDSEAEELFDRSKRGAEGPSTSGVRSSAGAGLQADGSAGGAARVAFPQRSADTD